MGDYIVLVRLRTFSVDFLPEIGDYIGLVELLIPTSSQKKKAGFPAFFFSITYYISLLPSNAFVKVISSVYSKSPPTGIP